MKKLFSALLSLAFISVNAQTADEIIQKYAANLGGLDAFNKIKTARMTGTFSAMGTDVPITIQIINGKALREELEINGSMAISVYNNGKAWTQNPFAEMTTPTEVQEGTQLNDLKMKSMLTPILMDYKAREQKVELVGQENVEGIQTYKIKLAFKENNQTTTCYISTADHTLVKTESGREIQGQIVNFETFYADLKEFNGVKFFMTRIQKINGEIFQTTNLTTIELNVPIDEKIFEMPAK